MVFDRSIGVRGRIDSLIPRAKDGRLAFAVLTSYISRYCGVSGRKSWLAGVMIRVRGRDVLAPVIDLFPYAV
jgi:hypothetical protein